MNALVLPLLCSLAWLAAFATGTVTGHVYAFLGTTALLSAALLLRDPAGRAHLRGGPVDVVIGTVVGVGSLVATYGLYPLVVAWFPGLRAEVVELYRIAAVAPASPAFGAVVVVAAAEEVIWRGALLAALTPLCSRGLPHRPLLGRGLAVVVAAAVYAVAQAGSGSPWLAFTALAFGVVWGVLAVWRGNVIAPLVAHLIWTPMVLSLQPLVDLAKN